MNGTRRTGARTIVRPSQAVGMPRRSELGGQNQSVHQGMGVTITAVSRSSVPRVRSEPRRSELGGQNQSVQGHGGHRRHRQPVLGSEGSERTDRHGHGGYVSRMDPGAEQEYSRRGESTAERLDRNYNELLQELRVAQAGVQILFAFLLSLAFTQRFGQANSFQRTTYVVTLLFAAGAAALLIASVAFHRIVFRQRQKDDLVDASNRLALGGLGMLLVAMVGAVLLILDVVLGGSRALLLTAAVAAWFVGFWVVLPLTRRERP